MSRLTYWIIAALLALLVAFLVLRSPSSGTEQKTTIAAASDLKFAMDEIVASFREEHPGEEIEAVYGSSGKFFTQIQQGAPYDVFFSADLDFARDLKASGHAVTEPVTYAIGHIVLWSGTRDATGLTLAGLTDPSIGKIAIANPRHAPYGRRAEEALRSAGIWDRVEGKLIAAENVSQAANYARTGAADVAIIGLSLAVNEELASKGGYWLVPEDLHAPLEQAFVVTRHGEGNATAAAFAAYIATPRARGIMTRHGFVLPSGTQGPST